MKRIIPSSQVVCAIYAIFACQDGLHAQSATSISANFNGTDIADTSFLWFNSHITSVSGATGPVTLFFRNQTISLTSPQTGNTYNLNVPDAEIRINASTGTASAVFAGNTWITTVKDSANNPFMAGYVWDVPTGENPKTSSAVTWSGDFYASQTGVSVNWQWSAAVYTTFSTNYSNLGVSPIDVQGAPQSGSPVNYTSFVTGGARGGGGSNFTGSNSNTGSVSNLSLIPEPSSSLLFALGAICCLLIRRRNAC